MGRFSYAEKLAKSRISRKALSAIIHNLEEAKHGGVTRAAMSRARSLKSEFPKGYQALKDAAGATIKGSATIMGSSKMRSALSDVRKHFMKKGVPAFSAKARALTHSASLKDLVKRGIAPAAAAGAGMAAANRNGRGFKYGGMAGCCPTCGRK